VETRTQTHNAVTFQLADPPDHARPEDAVRFTPLQQSVPGRRRMLAEGGLGGLLGRDAERLVAESIGRVRVIGHDAAAGYGEPIEFAARFWILCGAHALFVVDMIRATRPFKATYNWLLNDRDDLLDLKPVPPDRVVARRGQCGMKLFHLGDGRFGGPVYSFVHDCYHPLPDERGEGHSGSGLIVRWTDAEPATARTSVHAVALDGYGEVAWWHLWDHDASGGRLEREGRNWECRAEEGEILVKGWHEDESDRAVEYRVSLAGHRWAVQAH
jgi:hypothetical protein